MSEPHPAGPQPQVNPYPLPGSLRSVMTARGVRRNVPVRLAEPGITEIERLAAEQGVSRADMIRILLGEAIAARRRAAPTPSVFPHR